MYHGDNAFSNSRRKALQESLTARYSGREATSISRIVMAYFKRQAEDDPALLGNKGSELLDETMERLLLGEPVQYVLGETEFMGLRLQIRQGVLIPRPETEELVSRVLVYCRDSNVAKPVIYDIGTGSGCIALALQSHLPEASIVATDVSEKAMQIATENAEIHQLPVRFIYHDMQHQPDDDFNFPADVIVSNPPYIPVSEMHLVDQIVKEYEPHEALFVEDGDPLLFYKLIIRFSKINLKKSGSLFFEVNEYAAQSVSELIAGSGFEEVKVYRDISGKERIVCGILSQS